jgi:HEAT repeat protein
MRAIVVGFLTIVFLFHSAWADEPRTFFGKTVEDWIAVLRAKTSSEHDRLRAIRALGYFGSDARAAAPDLIALLDQKSFEVAAVNSLVQIGCGTERTVPILVEELRHGQRLTQLTHLGYRDGRDLLIRIGGPAVPALIELINGPDRGMRVCAAQAIGGIGPAAKDAVPSLVRAIERSDGDNETFTDYAAQALGRIGQQAKSAGPALHALLGDDSRGDSVIVTALTEIGAPPPEKLLETLLEEGDVEASSQLASFGPAAHALVPRLRAALLDNRPQVRYSAATALAQIDPDGTESIPVLIEALDHLGDDDVDASESLPALARLGPSARAAVPKLIELSEKRYDSTDVFQTLVRIDIEGKQCMPALILALNHEDPSVVAIAADCIGLLGPRAKTAVPALAHALTRDPGNQDGQDLIDPRVHVAKALRRIGQRAKSAIPILAHAVCRDDIVEFTDAAAAAAETLGSFGPAAKAAVVALIESVRTEEKNDVNCLVRKSAILALGRIGPDAKAAIPVLRSLARQDEKHSLYLPEALVALVQIDPEGKELAERWLEEPTVSEHECLFVRPDIDDRGMVIGALGKTSREIDWLTMRCLEYLDTILAKDDPFASDAAIEECLERLASFGTAARSAVPRLSALRTHQSPWVRMWAAEAIERIVPRAPSIQTP